MCQPLCSPLAVYAPASLPAPRLASPGPLSAAGRTPHHRLGLRLRLAIYQVRFFTKHNCQAQAQEEGLCLFIHLITQSQSTKQPL